MRRWPTLQRDRQRSRLSQEFVAKVGAGQLTPAAQRDLITDFAMLNALDSAYGLATPYLDEFIRSGRGGGADWTFMWLPEMRPFRQDARFQAYVTRLNLI